MDDYLLHNNFHFSCKSSASEVFDYLDDKEIFAEATEDVQAHQLGKISNKFKFILLISRCVFLKDLICSTITGCGTLPGVDIKFALTYTIGIV